MAGVGYGKIPRVSQTEGIDVVTGLPAKTGGPNASGNPVKPINSPEAQEAMRRNKTGAFADATKTEDQVEVAKHDSNAQVQAEIESDQNKAQPVEGGPNTVPGSTPASSTTEQPAVVAPSNVVPPVVDKPPQSGNTQPNTKSVPNINKPQPLPGVPANKTP